MPDSRPGFFQGVLDRIGRRTNTDINYLVKSGWWINLGSLSVSVFSFFLYLAFAHFLPSEIYGTYQYLLSVSAIVGAFTLTGMNGAVGRAVARGAEGTLKASIGLQLRYGIVPLLGAWMFAGYYLLHGNVTLGFGLLLIGIFVPVNNALNTASAVPGAKKDFRTSFLLNLLTNTLYYPALIVTAFYSKSALILLIANLVSQAIAIVFVYRYTIRHYHLNEVVEEEAIPYGKHLSFLGLLGTVMSQADSILTFHFLGATSLAIYSFATAVPDRVANLTKFIQVAAFPKLAMKSPEEIRHSIGSRLLWALIASAIVTGSYMVIAEPFFRLFFPTYMSSVPYSMLYALIIIPWVSGIFMTAFTAGRSTKKLYVFTTVIPILQFVLAFIGITLAGLWGLVISRLLTAFAQFVIGAWLLFFGADQVEGAVIPQ